MSSDAASIRDYLRSCARLKMFPSSGLERSFFRVGLGEVITLSFFRREES